jgi:hypothetical protein
MRNVTSGDINGMIVLLQQRVKEPYDKCMACFIVILQPNVDSKLVIPSCKGKYMQEAGSLTN